MKHEIQPLSKLLESVDSKKFRYTQVVTDSRKVEKGCLFVAIQGESFDGHDFIPQTIAQGAKGVLCRESYAFDLKNIPEQAEPVSFYTAPDTTDGYRALGAAWRKTFNIPVIAVAGSVGKTTTKEILSAILQGRWTSVLKTQGSQNGFVGIPMTLLELKKNHGAAVIEVGIDEIGAMQKHMDLIQADAAVITAIGPEHLEKLIDIPTVAREEGFALETVSRTGGLVAIRMDDPWIAPLEPKLNSPKKTLYSLTDSNLHAPSSSNHWIQGRLSEDGSELNCFGANLASEASPLRLKLPLLGRHNAINLLGAVAIAYGLGLNAEEIHKGLLTFRGADGRSELKQLPSGSPVVCDYYNANPSSVEAGLDLLTQISSRTSPSRPRWACLGDMLELGTNEEQFHRDLSKKISALKIENILLYGKRMKWLEDELKKQGYSGTLVHFNSHRELATSLKSRIQPGDAILIKGSRGMKMEEVWKALQ